MKQVLAIFFLLTVNAIAQVPVAEPPRIYIDTAWNAPAGMTWAAHDSINFKNALISSQPGDTIILDAGAIYSGNFTLPAKSNPNHKWIYIQSSAMSRLPSAGQRITPSSSMYMPKIVTPNSSPAFAIASDGGYVRFAGLEIYSVSAYGASPTHSPHPINGFTYYLLDGNKVSNVTVDRCYIHGSDAQDVNHGLGFWQNSSYIAVIDIDVRDIHGWTFDSQAFIAFSSPGPFKIVNNYLSATTEDVMFGASGGYSNPFVPSDIEFRLNHLFKPTTWMSRTTGTTPHQWTVKNNFECKACLRLMFTGNTLENAWQSGQVGSSILLTPRTNQSGYNSVDDDLTFQNNTLMNANMGFSVIGFDDNCVSPTCADAGETKRVVIRNNLILLRDPVDQASYHPMGFSMGHRMDSMLIEHNTVQGVNGSQPWASVYFNNAVKTDHPTNIWIRDNVLARQVRGDGGALGQAALDVFIPLPGQIGLRFSGNVMFVPSADKLATSPPHNFASTVAFQYLNASAGDYQLVVPNWLDTSDGKIAGVNMTEFNAIASNAR